MLGLVVALALLSVGDEGVVSPPAPVTSVITKPVWTARPTGEDMARLIPSKAVNARQGGGAVIVCKVTAEGRLADCAVAEETPPGLDYGTAALRLAKHFRMKPFDQEGRPVEGATVRVPIRWNLPPQ